jgi:nicotinamide-nucleotide amidase
MNAEIITIGDELLIGQTPDTNAQWMASRLTAEGLEVQRITSLPDRVEEILSCLWDASARSALVFVTGGLGPTDDDVTRQVISRFFRVEWEMNEDVYQRLSQYLSIRGYQVSQINKEQARTPKGSRVFINQAGTAPAMSLEKGGCRFYFMPGVPPEMRQLMDHSVLPDVKRSYDQDFYISEHLLTQGLPEAHLAKKLKGFEQKLPRSFKLAYLPGEGLVRLRLSARGQKRGAVEESFREILGELQELLSGYLVHTGNESPAEIVGRLLAAREYTLSTAESCTGGSIAGQITAIPGSSRYFKGSVVAYDNAIKKRLLQVSGETLSSHGAVSQPVVKQMARGILQLFETDFSIAVSGIAGPAGGTPDKPVGTTWIAVASRERVITRQFHFGDNRALNIRKAINTGLVMLKKMILKEI